MRVLAARFYRLTLPFKSSYKHHLAERTENETIALRLRSEAKHKGLGECIPRSYLTGETVSEAEEALSGPLLQDFVGLEIDSWGQLRGLLKDYGDRAERAGQLAAFAAVDMAMIDLWAREERQPVAAVLGGIKRWLFEYSGPISAGSRWQTRKRALMFKVFGFRQVKFKVGYQGDVDSLRLARRILGPRVDIRVDANCAWEREEALEKIRAMSESNITCVEQPVVAADIEGLGWLAERSPVPIMADESLTGLDSARRIVDLGVPVMLNVRLAKCGGYIRSMAIVELARKHRLGWQLGCLVGETGILSMAGRHFAAATADYRYLEGSYGPHFLRHDVVKGRVGFGWRGRARLVEQTGLGLVLHRGAIKRFCHQTSETEVSCPAKSMRTGDSAGENA
jgi:L-Ala-D/L-Glu epimerase / N-acetyl-D-glutamate racemase